MGVGNLIEPWWEFINKVMIWYKLPFVICLLVLEHMRSSSLVLLFPFLPAILFACAPDEFYTPNTCLLYGVVSTFGCRKCPANAVQYSQADESCVCKRGYYATNSRRLCNDYLGNGCGTCRVWPMVDDGFDCTPCAAGSSDVCVGDAYDVPVVMGAYWAGTFYVQEDFYVRCDRVRCPASGYMRIPMMVHQEI